MSIYTKGKQVNTDTAEEIVDRLEEKNSSATFNHFKTHPLHFFLDVTNDILVFGHPPEHLYLTVNHQPRRH